MWLWSPEAQPMDLRFYHDGMGQDTYPEQLEGLNITYEDYEPGFGTPYGIARTSELLFWAHESTPSAEDMANALAWRLKRLEAFRTVAGKLMERPQLQRDVFGRGDPEPDRRRRDQPGPGADDRARRAGSSARRRRTGPSAAPGAGGSRGSGLTRSATIPPCSPDWCRHSAA